MCVYMYVCMYVCVCVCFGVHVASGLTLVSDPFYSALPELPQLVTTPPTPFYIDHSAAIGQQTRPTSIAYSRYANKLSQIKSPLVEAWSLVFIVSAAVKADTLYYHMRLDMGAHRHGQGGTCPPLEKLKSIIA